MFFQFLVKLHLMFCGDESAKASKNVNQTSIVFKHRHQAVPELDEIFSIVIDSQVVQKIFIVIRVFEGIFDLKFQENAMKLVRKKIKKFACTEKLLKNS